MKRIKLLYDQLGQSKTSNNEYKLLKVNPSQLNPQIKIVVIDNPKTLNSLSKELTNEIINCLNNLNNDENTKVIIITGSGKSFVSGVDISSFKTENYSDLLKKNNSITEKLTNVYYTINKPMIAAVNGYCFGGGLELALCCDMIYCSDKSTLGFPEIKLALIPGMAGTQKLSRIFGILKANEFILSGKNIDLQEAHSRGLINDIIKHENLLSHTEKIAEEICKYDITALVSAKKAIKHSLESGLYNGIEYEKSLFFPLFDSKETKNAIDKFLNKNKKN